MSVITGIPAAKKKPKAGLLRVASPLPSGTDWTTGVQYVPEGCHAPDAVPICDLEWEKPRITPQSPVDFQPFGVIATDGCNDPWALAGEQGQRASRTLEMGQSAILARELLATTVTGNPDLQSTAEDLSVASGGDPVGWREAASSLLYHMMNAGYVGDVWIHAPSWLLPSFNAEQVGYTDPATGLSYIGPHNVIFDAGYSGLIGPGGDALGAVAPNFGWVYATGPVEFAFGSELEPTASGNPRQNDKYYVAERPGILRFDPCQVFGILVEVC